MGMTKTEHITRNGEKAIKVTCTCATHAPNADSAVITGATAVAIDRRDGADRDERIHGFVTMANHPAQMIRINNERKGIYAA